MNDETENIKKELLELIEKLNDAAFLKSLYLLVQRAFARNNSEN